MVLPCCVCIHSKEIGVVEDLGNFKKLILPGFNFIPFPLSQVAGTLSLRIQQLNVSCETKTKDNVFVRVEVAVQFRVIVVSLRNINCHQLNRGYNETAAVKRS
jgi:regulator of protease activity HflC (stomatin/prohibitin superfamily)